MEKIKNFTDLVAWQEGHKLLLEIYKITKKFPREELFCLVSQMRRAALSFTSNIAEGFGRASMKDKNRFYAIALGSLSEVYNQIIVARDLNYIKQEEFSALENQLIVVRKITYGLTKSSAFL